MTRGRPAGAGHPTGHAPPPPEHPAIKANALTLLAIFEQKMRLEVPLFQREYVWTEHDQ